MQNDSGPLFSPPILGKAGVLAMLGKGSLLIYLMHSLVYQACVQVAGKVGLAQRFSKSGLVLGIVVLLATLLVCVAIKYVVDSVPALQQAIRPRGVEDWVLTSRPRPGRSG